MVLTMMVVAAGLTFNPAEPAAMRLDPAVAPAPQALVETVAFKKKRTVKKVHASRHPVRPTVRRS